MGRRLRPSVGPLLELIGLSALAVAQPVFEDFRAGADTLVAYRADRVDVVVFVLGVALAVPVAIYLVELLVGLAAASWARAVHATGVFLLVASLASQVAKRETGLGWKRVAGIAVVAGLAGAVALWRWHGARLFVRFLALASAWFAAAFLFASPVTPLVLSSDRVPAADLAVGAPAPVVWIVLDELPLTSLLDAHDQIDRAVFPHLAALASDATWYRNSTTVATDTPQAVPALLTGRFPDDESTLPVAAEHEHNLFTLLGGRYELHVSEGWTQLCPPNLCNVTGGSEPAWPKLLREARAVWHEEANPKRLPALVRDRTETARRRDGQVADFVAGLDPSGDERPRLDFLHVVLPHVPFDHLPDGRRYRAPGYPLGTYRAGWFDEDAAAAARARHLLQVAYADRIVGQVVDRLRALHRYDASLIVVTADHGAAFTPGSPMRDTTEANVPEILWTPLLVKAPHQDAGVVDDRPVRSVDVLPTVADLLDVDLPWPVDGRAVGSRGRPGGDLRFFQSDGGELPIDDHQWATVDGRAGFERVLAAPAAVAGEGEFALYRSGRFGDLVGRRVRDLVTGGPLAVEGSVDQASRLEHADPDADDVPAYLSGRVTVAGADPMVAVALNGVVAGWGHGYLPTYVPRRGSARGRDDPQVHRWWTMVPPTLLRPGVDRVELFRIDGDVDAPVLRPVRLLR